MSDKKKLGCLASFGGTCFLLGLICWGIIVFSPDMSKQDKEEIQRLAGEAEKRKQGAEAERAEKKKQEEAAAAEKRKQDEAVEVERWKQDEAKQPRRMEIIQNLIAQGIFRKVDLQPPGATIWVAPSFYLLDFENKENFVSIVYGYAATNAKDDAIAVTLKDVLSGKTVGNYKWHMTGCGLRME